MKRFLIAASAILLASAAAHAQAVLTIKDGNGAPQSIAGHNGGTVNFWSNQSICDPSTAGQCAGVNSSGDLKVLLDNAAGTPTVNLGTIGASATAANQTAVIGPVAPGTAAADAMLTGCVYNSSAPSPSSSQQIAVQCDNSGDVKVNIASVTGITEGSTTAGATGALIMGTVLTAPQAFTAATSHIVGMNANGDIRADQMATGGNAGAPTLAHICQNHVTVSSTTIGDTQLVAPVSGKTVYVCDYNFSSNGSNNINLDSVTGASCAGAAAMDTLWYLAVNTMKTDANPYYRGLSTAVGSGVCLKTSAAVAVSFSLYYDQY